MSSPTRCTTRQPRQNPKTGFPSAADGRTAAPDYRDHEEHRGGLITVDVKQTMTATIQNQNAALNNTAIVMGQSFDTAKDGDLFYLPPEAFQNPEFQRGLENVPLTRRQVRSRLHHPPG